MQQGVVGRGTPEVNRPIINGSFFPQVSHMQTSKSFLHRGTQWRIF